MTAISSTSHDDISFQARRAQLARGAKAADKTEEKKSATAGEAARNDGFNASGEKDQPKSKGFGGLLSGLKEAFGERIRDAKAPLAEGREKDPTIAVIDDFTNAENDTTHGELVESVLDDNASVNDRDVQRYQAGGNVDLGLFDNSGERDFGESLDSYVETYSTGVLNGSSKALEDIMSDEDSKVRTVNQSLAAPEARIAENIYGSIQSDPEFRNRFLEYSGLPEGASEQEILQTLANEVAESKRTNENIQDAQARYDYVSGEARNRGITNVVAVGNHGRFADTLMQNGVVVDQEFFRNPLANHSTLNVGATNAQGGAADFTSPYAGAEISANGENVSTYEDGQQVTNNGTSFAAPQVAAAAAELAKLYPNLNAAQIEELLLGTSTNTGQNPYEVGYGTLNTEYANMMAQQYNRP
ncbi:MAG: S8 family serine peptidase [Candidatus Eremiobacteraeota bacterium]|nr:S8 family serine peptidase [Candidatus Eremiobacteraeota bacterium]